jgi:hypothetical protein
MSTSSPQLAASRVIPLSNIETFHGASAEQTSDGIRLSTSDQLYAFSAVIRLFEQRTRTRPIILRVGLSVERGWLGCGVRSADETEWIARGDARAGASRQEIELLLPPGSLHCVRWGHRDAAAAGDSSHLGAFQGD